MEPTKYQWNQILFSFIVLTLIGFGITWLFAIYFQFGFWELFALFSFLLFAQNALVQYFLPLQIIAELEKPLNFLQFFGFALFGGFINLQILYTRFGLFDSAALVIGTTVLGSGAVAILQTLGLPNRS